jgi:beta-ketodecanoyl-[acyl-carrier-protein] synthase
VAIEIQDALGAVRVGLRHERRLLVGDVLDPGRVDALRNGSANCVVVVNPEITSGHNNFELRDFHFIFGDACTALVLERTDDAVCVRPGRCSAPSWHQVLEQHPQRLRVPQLLGGRRTRPAGTRVPPERPDGVPRGVPDGRRAHLDTSRALDLDADDVRRFWLHQANLKMNQLIAKGVLGRLPTDDEAPVILDEYANTSSAGSVIAFHLHRRRPRGR